MALTRNGSHMDQEMAKVVRTLNGRVPSSRRTLQINYLDGRSLLQAIARPIDMNSDGSISSRKLLAGRNHLAYLNITVQTRDKLLGSGLRMRISCEPGRVKLEEYI